MPTGTQRNGYVGDFFLQNNEKSLRKTWNLSGFSVNNSKVIRLQRGIRGQSLPAYWEFWVNNEKFGRVDSAAIVIISWAET